MFQNSKANTQRNINTRGGTIIYDFSSLLPYLGNDIRHRAADTDHYHSHVRSLLDRNVALASDDDLDCP